MPEETKTQAAPAAAAAPAAPVAAPKPAGGVVNPKPTFGDPVANVLAQILPHFDKIRDDAEDAAREAAYQYVRKGGTNDAEKAAAVNLAARAELYARAATMLLTDAMLPADLAKWYHAQQD